MAGRSDVVDPTEVQIFHVFNRCVRRAFICGYDTISGRDYSHRKKWLRDRMEFLTGIFAFDIGTYSIMSNHFHYVLKSRPDIVRSWSDEEVAIRNMKLQGKTWFRKDGTQRKSAENEIDRIVNDAKELTRIRRKLSDLSSLMSYFDEYIAKKSNREDQVNGAYWEGTFGCELITDEASLLACMTYVDLNPVRAMIAQSLVDSEHTGAFERIEELRKTITIGKLEATSSQASAWPSGVRAESTLNWEREDHHRIGWMAPIEIDGRGDLLDADPSGRRPSRKGFLSISLLKYLEVVEWAGRMVRSDKRGSISPKLKPLFKQLGLSSHGFLQAMLVYSKKEEYFQATERKGIPEMEFLSFT